MSGEIQFLGPTGSTCYAIVLGPTGQAWNTSGTPAFEAPNVAHWASYAIACAEAMTGTGVFEGTIPAGITAAGTYSVLAFVRAGGSPATSDAPIGSGPLRWDGAKVAVPGNVTQVNGQAAGPVAVPNSAVVSGSPGTLTFNLTFASAVRAADLAGKQVCWCPGTANAVAEPTIQPGPTQVSANVVAVTVAYASTESPVTPVVGDAAVVG